MIRFRSLFPAMRSLVVIASVASTALLQPRTVFAAAAPAAAPAVEGSTADRAAIDALVAAEQEAWNRGDAKAFSARFAEDGFFTNVVGMRAYDRAGFERQHARIFSTIYKGSHNTLTVSKVKFVRPDVAVVDVESVLTGYQELPPGIKPAADGAVHTALQMVLTKESDGWTIASFHNVAITPLPPPKP